MLSENLEKVRKTVENACHVSGRDPGEVLVLAVSKMKPAEDIQALYDVGQRDFGENYVQEMQKKHEALPQDIRWHMIGHLQKNKVKYIAPYVTMIHSVDSGDLAAMIEKEAAKCGRTIDVLIEVNVAGEDTKYGTDPAGAAELAAYIRTLPHVKLRGLMTSAPYVADPEENRPVFRELRQLMIDLNRENDNNDSMDILSMGMSNDFAVAVEEGSTCVRVGTLIFGERDYGNKQQSV